jgi:ferredoxin
VKVSLLFALGGAVAFAIAAAAPPGAREVVVGCVAVVVVAAAALFLWPMGKTEAGPRVPGAQIDERDNMFSRFDVLAPGMPEYEAYYAAHPEKQDSDNRTRTLPGLMSPDSLLANPLAFAAAGASFRFTNAFADELDGPPAEEPESVDPMVMTPYLKALACYYGARSAGITTLRPYHLYSHVGMDPARYGERVANTHSSAVAFTMEMNFAMMGSAPEAPTVMESAREYGEGAKIALQLAYFIRSLGYAARAHIVDHYDMVAPLVARDAGLGEIGRHGLLITPELGTRVRLGVVTTDLPLQADPWESDPSVLDFCTICKKCATNCPSNSIPLDDRRMIDGALRWRIDPETCYRYWCSVGTDCGRCMAVCPYSHPDTFWHDAVRTVGKRSGAARRVAIQLDDLFYGRRPASRPAPGWIPARKPRR